MEARAKSEVVDLSFPIAQWVVSDFNNKYTFTLTNRETGAELVLDLKATSNPGEYEITGGAIDNVDFVAETGTEIAAGVTVNGTVEGNQALIGKVVRFDESTVVSKTYGFWI